MSYPYIRDTLKPSEIMKFFMLLKETEFKYGKFYFELLVKTENIFKGFNINSPYGITTGDLNTWYYNDIIDYFQEDARLACRRKTSPYKNTLECFEKNKAVIMEESKKFHKENPERSYNMILRSNIVYKCYPCTEINPAFCLGVYRFFAQYMNITSILDMSAGRGTRMTAAIAFGADYYLGVDPNPMLHKNYDKMIKMFDPKGATKCNVVKSGFESDWQIPSGFPKEYDLMFSSPPYFDLEIYSDDKEQSISKFSKLQEWHELFMFRSLDKIMSMLRVGGICAININNPRNLPEKYVEPIIEYMQYRSNYLGVFQFFYIRKNGSASDAQPVWVFQKKN